MEKQYYEIIRTVSHEEVLCILASSEEEALEHAKNVALDAAGGEVIEGCNEFISAYVNSYDTDPNELSYYSPMCAFDAECSTTVNL